MLNDQILPQNQSKEDKGMSAIKEFHCKTPEIYDATLKNKIFFVG